MTKLHEDILSAIQKNQSEIDATVRKNKSSGSGASESYVSESGASQSKTSGKRELRVSSVPDIPDEISSRHPLITTKGWENLKRLSQNKNAPRWNYFTIGDKVDSEDLNYVESFRKIFFQKDPINQNCPSESILAFVDGMTSRSTWFEESIPEGTDLKKSWHNLRTMKRADLAAGFCDIVPRSSNYDRLIVYDTSGTTGHAIVVPHHPRALALNHVFAEYALKAYGISTDFSSIKTACINVCAQQNTYVFSNIFSVWNEAAFAKVNLKEDEWSTGIEGARQFFKDANPHFITADPVTIGEMLRWELPVRPAAIFSTALVLSLQLKKRAEEYFKCPVIDWYSTTETGPIGFAPPAGTSESFADSASSSGSCPSVDVDSSGQNSDYGDYLQIFGPDIFVELLDEHGYPVENGERGEITITGGRNPWLPLLRYRTGDYAAFKNGRNDRLYDFLGREPVIFRAVNGSIVNAVDIARTLRLCCPFVQHQFTQFKDLSCELLIKPLPSVNINIKSIESSIFELFGDSQKLKTKILETNSTGKLISYISEVA
jgi:phenylacetate-CoA ligase